MAVTIDGTTGVSAVQAGAVTTSDLPAGTVLQVVQAVYATETETSSSTFSDTGLTVSITPSAASSKVLVIVSQDIGKRTNDLLANLRLMRNSTSLGNIASLGTNSAVTIFGNNSGFAYLDSPATTSATTYKTQFNSSNGLAAARVCSNNQQSTITVLEIAA